MSSNGDKGYTLPALEAIERSNAIFAKITADYYKLLVRNGIPKKLAVELTAIWIRSLVGRIYSGDNGAASR